MTPCQKHDWTCCYSKLDGQHVAEKCFVEYGKGLGCCEGLQGAGGGGGDGGSSATATSWVLEQE